MMPTIILAIRATRDLMTRGLIRGIPGILAILAILKIRVIKRMSEMVETLRITEMLRMIETIEMLRMTEMIETMTSILKRAVRAIMSVWTVNQKSLKLLLACKLMMLSRSTKLVPRVKRAPSRMLSTKNNLWIMNLPMTTTEKTWNKTAKIKKNKIRGIV